MQRKVEFAAEAIVLQLAGAERTVGADLPLDGTGQPLLQTVVAGGVVLGDEPGSTERPGPVVGDGVVLAIHAVGLRTVVGESLGIGGAVVVLGIAGIDVALSAEARFEIDDLVGGHLPRQHPAEIAIAYPFASGHGTARVDGMSEVDVGIVRIGLVRAAVRAEAQGFGQRPAEAEVGAARGAILGAFRNVGEHRHGTTQTIGRALGDDVDYPARRAGTVACRRGPTEDLDALDLLRRHPVAVAAGVAFAAPAVAHRVARADRFAVDQDQGVLRPHAADVDLPVVAALAAGTVAGEVDPGHGADDLGEIVHRRALPDVLGGDDGYPRCLLELLFGGAQHHLVTQLDHRFGAFVQFFQALVLGQGLPAQQAR
ncbi:hypothetical protein Q093_04313 [Pseudomonas aeruginosa CF614]|nr:hypothetical protein Q093_04313 [Pseudomonas aeruginosa CF614]